MVGKSSPIKNAQELLAAGKSRKLKVGVTHVGSIDHITPVGFSRKAGLLMQVEPGGRTRAASAPR